ncbi:hypothetical protein AB0L41_49095 [Amycolatopsis mediterranei]|uniref:hypothetical protein n=1 Tax=Amycolatopsis mediterranei TaxID=33910 RepID=UPI0034453F4B
MSGYAAEPMYVEIQRCRDKLVELTGSPGGFFRQSQASAPPHGNSPKPVAPATRRCFPTTSIPWTGRIPGLPRSGRRWRRPRRAAW